MTTPTWDTATWVAVLALVVSGMSFIAAIWAAWVSHNSLSHARRVHEEDRRVAFERERSQLLEIINTGRGLLDNTRIRIGTLKANFDAAPPPVQALLTTYTGLFSEYYPRVEAGVRQANSLLSEVSGWDQDTGIQGLVRHQARFRTLLHEDRIAHDIGVSLVATFEVAFAKAKSMSELEQ